MESNEQVLTSFLQNHYTDERLTWLLAHAESGQLAYVSCCCFIGVANADHALRGHGIPAGANNHVFAARMVPGAYEAEEAYRLLGQGEFMVELARAMSAGKPASSVDQDVFRRAKLIPLINAEINRRALLRSQSEVSEMVVAV